jgi:putative ABC transport system substrate-binding protein
MKSGRAALLVLLALGVLLAPLAADAQQAMPVIGFLSVRSADDRQGVAAAFRRGLNEAGFHEGQNVAIEYRWAEFRYDQLSVLAADLVRRKVAVIAAISGTPSVMVAKAATATIPIVFANCSDPVTSGVVTSLSRPGGNVTGATCFTTGLGEKRLELLRELVPKATIIAVLVNPENPVSTAEATGVEAAARAVGQQTRVLKASAQGHIDDAFELMVKERIGALLATGDPFLLSQDGKLAALAARHAIPAIYFDRVLVVAGGLMSYGTIQADTHRQAGIYVARILKGAKPGDLPVMVPTKFELVINLKTAKALGLTIPPSLLLRADQVIE